MIFSLLGCSIENPESIDHQSSQEYFLTVNSEHYYTNSIQKAERNTLPNLKNDQNLLLTNIDEANTVSFTNYESSNYDQSQILSMIEEKFHTLNNGKFLFLEPIIKKINDTTFQTIHYAPTNKGEEGWTFSTWKLDDETGDFSLVDQTTYNAETQDFGTDLAKYWYNLWNSKKENYHPYKNLVLEKDILKHAKNGELPGVEYRIGTAINTIQSARENLMEEGYYEGAKYLFYPEDTYFYDENSGKVEAIAYKGHRLNITLGDVQSILGNPNEEAFDHLENEPYFMYKAGDYNLYFYANKDTKIVSNVILR